MQLNVEDSKYELLDSYLKNLHRLYVKLDELEINQTTIDIRLEEIEQLLEETRNLKQRYRDWRADGGTIVIGVFGQFSAGKSMFINSLLGENLLKTGVTPTTSKVAILKYSDILELYGVKKNEDSPTIIRRALSKEEWGSISSVEDFDYFEIYYPSSILRHITLIDTPGFSEKKENKAVDDETRSWMQKVDRVFWIVDSHQGLTKNDLSKLEEFQQMGKKIYCIVNKMDSLPPRQRKSRIENIKQQFEFESIYSYSAKDILEKRKHDRQLEDFMKNIYRKLYDNIKSKKNFVWVGSWEGNNFYILETKDVKFRDNKEGNVSSGYTIKFEVQISKQVSVQLVEKKPLPSESDGPGEMRISQLKASKFDTELVQSLRKIEEDFKSLQKIKNGILRERYDRELRDINKKIASLLEKLDNDLKKHRKREIYSLDNRQKSLENKVKKEFNNNLKEIKDWVDQILNIGIDDINCPKISSKMNRFAHELGDQHVLFSKLFKSLDDNLCNISNFIKLMRENKKCKKRIEELHDEIRSILESFFPADFDKIIIDEISKKIEEERNNIKRTFDEILEIIEELRENLNFM